MNSFFAALAAVVLGLMLTAGTASAAHKPAHATPARKSTLPSRPVAKSAARTVTRSVAKPTPSRAASPKVLSARARALPPAAKSAHEVRADKAPRLTRAEKRQLARTARATEKLHSAKVAEKGSAGRAAAKGAPLPREVALLPREVASRKHHGHGKGARLVQVAPPAPAALPAAPKGRPLAEPPARVVSRAEPAPAPLPPRETARRPYKAIGREAFVPIGREAFVPTSPPVRQPVPVYPPAAQYPAPAPRQAVSLPPPPPAQASPASLRPTLEAPPVAPKPLPRAVVGLGASVAGLSAAEAAAASAAAVTPPRPEPAPAYVPAPLASVALPAPQPAAGAASTPLASQTNPVRPSRGVARAYAMDGATFYQSGRKIRVHGLDVKEPGMTSEHATQRLQRTLDSGNLTVEPVEVDGAGHTLAVVRVNGRNVADTVRAAAN